MTTFSINGVVFDESYQGWTLSGPQHANALGQGDVGPIRASTLDTWTWTYGTSSYPLGSYQPFAPADAADTVDTFLGIGKAGFKFYFLPPFNGASRTNARPASLLTVPVLYLDNWTFASVAGASCHSMRSDINWPTSGFGSPPSGTGAWAPVYDVCDTSLTGAVYEKDALVADMLSHHPGGSMLVIVLANGTGSMGPYVANLQYSMQGVFDAITALGYPVQWVFAKFSEWSVDTPSPTYNFDGSVTTVGGDGTDYGGGYGNIPITFTPILNQTTTPNSSYMFGDLWLANDTGGGGDGAEADLEALRWAVGWAKAHDASWGSKHILHVSDTQSKYPYANGGFPAELFGEAGLRLFGRGDQFGLLNSPRLLKTDTGNNPGSLQANPAPRLRQTGNVHL